MAPLSFGSGALDALPALQRALGRLLDDPSTSWRLSPSSRSVYPPINVFEDRDGALVIRAEVPGLDPTSLAIDVEAQRLTISGQRPREVSEGGDGYHRRERRFGSFSRSVQLPTDLDTTKATAAYRDGMLAVRVEKAETAKPRRIHVA
jgi:HSP20 family protein